MLSPENFKVLIIDDELEIRRFLNSLLIETGFKVIEAENAKLGLKKVKEEAPDVILLDLGLPDYDGMNVIEKVRSFSDIPIIVISARGREDDKIKALDIGADDYLTKPFSAAELIARVKVALRHRVKKSESDIIEISKLKINFAASTVSLNGEELKLTPIEFKLLKVLVKNPGRLVTHKQLLAEVWDRITPENNNYLRIHIQHLRKKLNDNSITPKFITTETGVGYRFIYSNLSD